MNNSLLDAFDERASTVRRYWLGEMPQPKSQPQQQMMMMNNQFQQRSQQGGLMNDIQPLNDTGGMGMDMFGATGGMNGGMNNGMNGMNNGMNGMNNGMNGMNNGMNSGMNNGMNNGMNGGMNNLVSSMNGPNGGMNMRGSAVRNQPFLSFGNHRMSLMGQMSQNPNHRMSLMGRMSEVSYGRAMSGLSALSIDWENLEDFDVNVDHSEHINNNLGASAVAAAANAMGRGNRGGPQMEQNSNMRQNFNMNNGGSNMMHNDDHLQQFKI